MDLSLTEDNLSDDDVFFGKLTLKEVKKHIFFHDDDYHSVSYNDENQYKSDDDTSLKIIETHSEPDVYSVRDEESLDFGSNLNPIYSPDKENNLNSTDDSFLRIEKLVNDLCVSPSKSNNPELDNTLETIEKILNSASSNINGNHDTKVFKKEDNNYNIPAISISPLKINNTIEPKDEEDKFEIKNDDSKSITPLNPIESLHVTPVKNSVTETKYTQNLKTDIKTPLEGKKHSEAIFKTPKNVFSSKICPISSSKKIGKCNNYQHIASPVASYIKNGPQVPLIRDVHPKKPLPGSSFIPKLVKTTNDLKVCNKENVLLPSVAYKSAKQTKMVTVPDRKKLPQSPWAQKVASSQPKPVVIKHNHREVNPIKRLMETHKEDSFGDLSLHQADLSVCTQKSAISKPI